MVIAPAGARSVGRKNASARRNWQMAEVGSIGKTMREKWLCIQQLGEIRREMAREEANQL